MTRYAVRALADVDDGDRDNLLDLGRESPIGKDGLPKSFKGGLLVGSQIASPAG